MAERAFTKLQYGKETVRGTAVAATKVLQVAPGPIPVDRRPVYPNLAGGVRARDRAGIIQEYLALGSLNFDNDHPLYYQALPMLFSCGVKGNVTAVEQTGSQSDYLWTFTPSLTAGNAPDTITLEMGDDVQAYEIEYLLFERIRIAGDISQSGDASPVTCTADYFGRQVSTASFTGALSLTSPEFLNAKLARLYLDTTWAGVGGTEKTSTLRGFELEILTGLHPKFLGDANLYFATYGEAYIDVMLSLTLEGNANADAIWDAYRAQSLQVARLSISGSQIGTGDNYNLTADVGGTFEEVIPLSSEDRGNNIHTAVLHGTYDATGAKLLQLACTTNHNAI